MFDRLFSTIVVPLRWSTFSQVRQDRKSKNPSKIFMLSGLPGMVAIALGLVDPFQYLFLNSNDPESFLKARPKYFFISPVSSFVIHQ